METENKSRYYRLNNGIAEIITALGYFTLIKSADNIIELWYATRNSNFSPGLVVLAMQAGRLVVTCVILFKAIPALEKRFSKKSANG
jgi:hypothetical protein